MKVSIGPIRKKKERKIKIRIDEYDTWNMDHTLALIALPMLKQLKDTANGSPMVDLEDVPYEMRYMTYNDWDSQKCFNFYHEDKKEDLIHERWMWAIGEMIFAMEQIVKDDDSEFYNSSKVNPSASFDEQLKQTKVDWEGLTAYHDRIHNGCRLFGKYFQNLWD